MAQALFRVASVVFLGVLRRLVRYIVFLGDKFRDDRVLYSPPWLPVWLAARDDHPEMNRQKGLTGKRSQHECLLGTFEICDISEEVYMEIFNATLRNATSVHRFLLVEAGKQTSQQHDIKVGWPMSLHTNLIIRCWVPNTHHRNEQL
jgi:hypothetical protein